VLTGIRMPRMNAIMERWVQSCHRGASRPLPTVERTPSPACPARVRTVLQPAPRPSSPRPGGPTTSRPGIDHRSRADREPDHPPTRPARRNPSRIFTCGLNCTDGIFGRHRVAGAHLR
jgi:hypothetical protein